ncbi:MAG: hypothetical protein K2H85_03195 [Allobaculum sp.]|nr:hypothetical protein [Allobaculum sp.]
MMSERDPRYHIYPFTLEERVEVLERRMGEIQRTSQIDWEAISWNVVIIIVTILTFVFALIKF